MKYKVGDIVFSTIWEKDVIIRGVHPNLIYEVADIEYLSRFMYTHELNLKSREDDIDKDMEEHQKLCDEIMAIQGVEPIEAEMEEVWHCPDGYVFKDENGNVINATKIVLEKKKKEYPKTYEECCKIMQVARPTIWFDYDDVSSISEEGDEYECHIENTLCAFRKLLICRDAYWKIAGEEMGLGEPWEPDWNDGEWKWCMSYSGNYIEFDQYKSTHHILAFPTEEMRDAFYENFKEEIESCKELL